jgi:hypothetical protein
LPPVLAIHHPIFSSPTWSLTALPNRNRLPLRWALLTCFLLQTMYGESAPLIYWPFILVTIQPPEFRQMRVGAFSNSFGTLPASDGWALPPKLLGCEGNATNFPSPLRVSLVALLKPQHLQTVPCNSSHHARSLRCLCDERLAGCPTLCNSTWKSSRATNCGLP